MNRYYKYIALLLLFSVEIASAATQSQWFTSIAETGNWIKFSCENQCIALAGDFLWNDNLNLKWNLSWEWVIWYSFAVWQKMYQWDFIKVSWAGLIEKKFEFSKSPLFSQLPQDTKVLLIVQWKIDWNLSFGISKNSFSESISAKWSDFWKNETLTPYSINLRYWIKISSTSIIKIMYILFLFALIWVLFIDKKKREKYILFLWLGFFLFLSFRNILTINEIYSKGTSSPNERNISKSFFDLWDYISFTDKVRTNLKLDSNPKGCKIFVDSAQDWPFVPHWSSVYLKPCEKVDDISKADYILIYKKPNSWSGSLLLESDNSFLLKTNKK